MAAIQITGEDVLGMTQHWLGTPVCGYLGSDYGSDLKALLQQPQSAVNADAVIPKLRSDVPVLNMLDDQAVELYWRDEGIDRKWLVIGVGGQLIVAGESARPIRTTKGG